MKRLIVLPPALTCPTKLSSSWKLWLTCIALAAMVAITLPTTAWAWGAAKPDSSDDYINRTKKTFQGHELLLHDALLMLKAKRLIPASLGETYLQPIYSGPKYYPTLQTSWGYNKLITGVRLPDNDIVIPGWGPSILSSADHYYDPYNLLWFNSVTGWNSKTGFMYYVNGGVYNGTTEAGAISRFQSGDILGGFQALGYALHYLEDGSMPYHMSPMLELATGLHGAVDARGDGLIYNERLQFEKDALERNIPYGLLSFTDTARVSTTAYNGSYKYSQNLNDFYHNGAADARAQLNNISWYYYNGGPNWTEIDNILRPLMKNSEDRIALLVYYVFSKAGMYPASLTNNSGFAHPNTAFLRVWQPTNYKVTGIIDQLGQGGFGTVLLNRCWANDNLTIKGWAGLGKRTTITLVGRDGRKISENTGPVGGEAVISNTSNGSNTGWYTLYVTSPDITSGTSGVSVNVYNNQAKDVLNSDTKGKLPPVLKPVVASGGGKTGKPVVATKGESPSACEIGYNVSKYAERCYINSKYYDTDLFWTDMSYNYVGNAFWSPQYNNAVIAANCLRFDNFYYDHRIDWKWYRPDGVLYNSGGPAYIYGMYTTGYTWNWWDVVWGVYLKWDGYDYWMQNYQGIWRQEVYIDNVLYTTQYFGVNTPPTITNVANGAYINGGPLEIGTNLKGVPNFADIRLDGTSESNRVSLDYAAPYSGVVNASILADGAHTAYAFVQSGTPHGNGNRQAALSFTVDKTKPAVSMTAPANGSRYAAGSAITVSSNATDAYGINKVVFYANGKEIASDNASPYSCTYTMPNPAIAVEFVSKAFDLAGNSSVSSSVTVQPPGFFSDTFDDGTLSPWTSQVYDGAAINAVSSAYCKSPTYSLRHQASAGCGSAYASYPAQTTTFTAEWDMMSIVDGSGLTIGLDNWSYYGVYVGFGGGSLRYRASSGHVILCPRTLGQWYHVKAVVNPQTQNVKIYVDGSLKYDGIMYGNITSFNKVRTMFGTVPYEGYFDNINLTSGAKDVDANAIFNGDKPALPTATQLTLCTPNPTTGANKFSYQLASPGNVSLKVYNISGQLVKTLANEIKPAGYHSVHWDGKDANGNKVAAGVYLYRISAGDYSATRKLTVLR